MLPYEFDPDASMHSDEIFHSPPLGLTLGLRGGSQKTLSGHQDGRRGRGTAAGRIS